MSFSAARNTLLRLSQRYAGRLPCQRIDHDGLTMLAGHLAYVFTVAGAAGHRGVRLFARFPMFSDIQRT